MSDLDDLLKLYDQAVKDYIKKNGHFLCINISLTSMFLQTCRERIIAGHKSYGNDYKTKDCLKERDAEVYDYLNYTLLDKIQKKLLTKR